MLTPEGPPQWKVRYAPREVGDYSVTFTARDRSGQVGYGPAKFRCVAGPAEGFVRISDQKSGPKYFRTDTGRTVFLIGHNVTTYAPDSKDPAIVFRRWRPAGRTTRATGCGPGGWGWSGTCRSATIA